jgi:hypothetical protein
MDEKETALERGGPAVFRDGFTHGLVPDIPDSHHLSVTAAPAGHEGSVQNRSDVRHVFFLVSVHDGEPTGPWERLSRKTMAAPSF